MPTYLIFLADVLPIMKRKGNRSYNFKVLKKILPKLTGPKPKPMFLRFSTTKTIQTKVAFTVFFFQTVSLASELAEDVVEAASWRVEMRQRVFWEKSCKFRHFTLFLCKEVVEHFFFFLSVELCFLLLLIGVSMSFLFVFLFKHDVG